MLTTCPFCGEPTELALDVDQDEVGTRVFTQDCEVCCHPIEVHVRIGADGQMSVQASREWG